MPQAHTMWHTNSPSLSLDYIGIIAIRKWPANVGRRRERRRRRRKRRRRKEKSVDGHASIDIHSFLFLVFVRVFAHNIWCV